MQSHAHFSNSHSVFISVDASLNRRSKWAVSKQKTSKAERCIAGDTTKQPRPSAHPSCYRGRNAPATLCRLVHLKEMGNKGENHLKPNDSENQRTHSHHVTAGAPLMTPLMSLHTPYTTNGNAPAAHFRIAHKMSSPEHVHGKSMRVKVDA